MSKSYKIIEEFRGCIQSINNLHSEEDRSKAVSVIEDKVISLDKYRKSLNQSEAHIFKEEFQKSILPITNKSDLCLYCYDKPRGYAGDCFAMERIWHGRTDNDQCNLGSDETGKILNVFTLESPNCKANEYRINYFSDIIRGYKNSNIASIGCGSAIEIEQVFKNDESLGNNKFYLMDQDQGALDFIKEKISNQSNMNFCPGNVLRQIIKFDKDINFDFIYSSGLFDYLPLKQAQKVAKNLFNLLKPQGKLIITNAHPDNPSRFWMEYTMDWYLDYKNSEEMIRIAELIDKEQSECDLFTDDFNVYQYLHIRRK